ncbi:UDP-2,3-diacylglucosamine diphosphatase [Ramlibacter sp. H39-3-26]|uniref:UDP-2,3-diacylglucosamine diphosphatase n=1 Tax=Curvibacter soli TaxID=3031331 RepID=UPI0023DA87CE|nr:UDP-2,3-diacylglucosamine diphosphatase [Ramlibacter sp. H39-3-26]MDF1485289.1 UDP-2,3-diacylglucosamine diphosphatase [Ramlibacter sp. H39-3-26]
MDATALGWAELAAPAHWRAVDFISDLHLQDGESATVAAWERYLRETPADALFILGDLFEVWVGDDAADDAAGFEARCAAALHAAAARMPLYFMQGNRDFLLGPRYAARAGMALLADPTAFTFGPQRYLLSHGDALCLGDTDYLRFRAEVRAPAWQAAFLARPLAERRAIARGLRDRSEARKHAGMAHADVDAVAARAWLQAAHCATLIHGHTHKPADHALGDGLRRMVLSDWDAAAHPPRLQALRLDAQGSLRRITLPA